MQSIFTPTEYCKSWSIDVKHHHHISARVSTSNIVLIYTFWRCQPKPCCPMFDFENRTMNLSNHILLDGTEPIFSNTNAFQFDLTSKIERKPIYLFRWFRPTCSNFVFAFELLLLQCVVSNEKWNGNSNTLKTRPSTMRNTKFKLR